MTSKNVRSKNPQRQPIIVRKNLDLSKLAD